MNEADALKALADAGIVNYDAQTSLSHAMRGFKDINSMLASVPRDASNIDVLQTFGQDAGRAVIVLRAL